MPNLVTHFEIYTQNPSGVAEFYRNILAGDSHPIAACMMPPPASVELQKQVQKELQKTVA